MRISDWSSDVCSSDLKEDPSKRGHYTAGGLYAPHIKDSVPDELPDVDAIPAPDVVAEPRSRYGNRSPYQELGKSFRVLDKNGREPVRTPATNVHLVCHHLPENKTNINNKTYRQ